MSHLTSKAKVHYRFHKSPHPRIITNQIMFVCIFVVVVVVVVMLVVVVGVAADRY